MRNKIVICGEIIFILTLILFFVLQQFNFDLKDDWVYKRKDLDITDGWGSTTNSKYAFDSVAESSIGYSTGGAKDINNFRDNIKDGYFPLAHDITYEGIFYDYYFDTNTNSVKGEEDLFYPSASTAISKDTMSNEDDYYLTVGLNSNIKASDFERKKLNLVIVLDISGSMISSIDDYYYDFNENNKEHKSKMRLANESVNLLIDQLAPTDSLGIVLFDDKAYLAKPIHQVSGIDMEKIKEHMLEVEAMGGTNFEAGYKEAVKQFTKYGVGDPVSYENRIIVITDAMPNIGETSDNELLSMMRKAQLSNINTTFIGVGVDFNTEVVKNITNVKGANYYKVSSEEEFKKRMGEEFDYMVTPMIYDLNMTVDSKDFEVVKIYGTDDIDSENNSEILHVNTLFPSSSNESGEVKGGVILLKLKRIGTDNDLTINMSWEEINGKKGNSSLKVNFKEDNYYDNTGIRKAITLTRYVNAVKNWVYYDRDKNDRFLITYRTGFEDFVVEESENERISIPLTCSDEYKKVFNNLKTYMEKEIVEIDDTTMNQEIEILDKILAVKSK